MNATDKINRLEKTLRTAAGYANTLAKKPPHEFTAVDYERLKSLQSTAEHAAKTLQAIQSERYGLFAQEA